VASSVPETPGLEPNIVSFWGLVSQSMAGMAPTCDVVAFMTAGAAFALVALPLSYLFAFILMFIEVNTIYHLSKHRNSAGGYYSYVSAGLGPAAALVTALMVIFYQVISVAGVPVYVAGVFLPGLAHMVGIALPTWFWVAAMLFFIGVPWLLTVLGIRPTVKTLMLTSTLEIVFLIVASIIIIGRVPIVHPLHPFDLAAVGVKGVAMGMIFAITSFIGVGSHAPLGEETKQGIRTQKGRLIGKAAIVSLTLVGAALTLSAYALTVGWGQSHMGSFATANAPGVTVFLHYLGPVGAIALVVLAVNSALMDCLALLTSSARVLYAVGRDKLLQTSFAQVNGRRAPAKGVTLLAGIAVVIGIGFGMWLGPVQAFNVLTTAVLFGLVTAHTLMNVSLMRVSHGERNVVQVVFHFALPILAMALFLLVLYESIVPFVFPLAWSAILWVLVMIPATVYAWRATRHLDAATGHRLGVVVES
jgi:amino acid transporter